MNDLAIKKDVDLSVAKPKVDTVKNLIDRLVPQIKTALPKQINVDRFARICMTVLRTNPKLLECSQNSLMAALVQAAQLGLEPGILGQCYLIPYNGECEFQLGYKGMIDLVRRSGEIQSISANVFYKSEIESGKFKYSLGTEPKIHHEPDLNIKDENDYAGAYAVATFKDGGFQFVVMGRSQIDKIQKSSKSAGSPFSPWNKHTVEMAKKTPIRRLFKYLPVSAELASRIMNDQVIKKEIRNDLTEICEGDVINVHDFEEAEQKPIKEWK